jgi:hypothetical protein
MITSVKRLQAFPVRAGSADNLIACALKYTPLLLREAMRWPPFRSIITHQAPGTRYIDAGTSPAPHVQEMHQFPRDWIDRSDGPWRYVDKVRSWTCTHLSGNALDAFIPGRWLNTEALLQQTARREIEREFEPRWC